MKSVNQVFKQGDIIVLQGQNEDGSWTISRNGKRFNGKIRLESELNPLEMDFPPTANNMYQMLLNCLKLNERDTLEIEPPDSISQRMKEKSSPKKISKEDLSLPLPPLPVAPIPAGTKQFMQTEIDAIGSLLEATRAEIKLIIKSFLEEFNLDPSKLNRCFTIQPTADEKAFGKLLATPYINVPNIAEIPEGDEKVNTKVGPNLGTGELALAPRRPFQHKFLLCPRIEIMTSKIKQKHFEAMETLDFNVTKWLDKHDYQSPVIFIINMFQNLGLTETFNIPPVHLFRFLVTVCYTYRDVPFHNFFHAFNVTHTMYYFLSLNEVDQILSPLQKFAMMIATLCHDCDHPGLNNAFQAKASTRVGVLHKKSTLENHHLLTCLNILSKEECNILINLDASSKTAILLYIRHLILVTDMSLHGVIHRRLLERKKVISKVVKNRGNLPEEDAILVMCTLMKCSDLSNEIRPNEISQKWAKLVLSEFFKQAQKESELHLPVTPFMDQHKIIIAKEQINFINGLCMPLFENLVDMFPGLSVCMDQMLSNRRIWQKRLNLFFATNPEDQKHLSDVSIWQQKVAKGGWGNFMKPDKG